ncbi:MAG: LptE family protein [Bacteroidota bacterium]
MISIKIKNLLNLNLIIGLVFCTFSGCTVQYSMGGATIESDVKTITVDDFSNNSPGGPANLGQYFTNELKDKFQSQTSLSFVEDDGDLIFQGEITDFNTSSTSVTGDETASQTRLTVTVSVNFVNQKHPDNNFNSDFTHYEDFDANQNLSDVEDELVEDILAKIVDDIFDKSVVNW